MNNRDSALQLTMLDRKMFSRNGISEAVLGNIQNIGLSIRAGREMTTQSSLGHTNESFC